MPTAAYMEAYRKQPGERLKARTRQAKRLRVKLEELVDALDGDGEQSAAQLLQVAVATMGCAIIELNSAVGALPSRGVGE